MSNDLKLTVRFEADADSTVLYKPDALAAAYNVTYEGPYTAKGAFFDEHVIITQGGTRMAVFGKTLAKIEQTPLGKCCVIHVWLGQDGIPVNATIMPESYETYMEAVVMAGKYMKNEEKPAEHKYYPAALSPLI
jgi:hypothetical protein